MSRTFRSHVLTYEATNRHAESAMGQAPVLVPHDHGRGSGPVDGAVSYSGSIGRITAACTFTRIEEAERLARATTTTSLGGPALRESPHPGRGSSTWSSTSTAGLARHCGRRQ